jgi:hypothetical protein
VIPALDRIVEGRRAPIALIFIGTCIKCGLDGGNIDLLRSLRGEEGWDLRHASVLGLAND